MTVTAQSTTPEVAPAPAPRVGPKPDIESDPRPIFERVLVGVFVAVPLLALISAVPLAWGWGLDWHALVIAIAFYYITGLGISMGLHRYFTHGSFKATRGFKIALAIAGSLALEGPVITWVADHRRHHKYSDMDGDPHSPWRFGDDWKALTKGLVFAHVGWLFDGRVTSEEKFCPDWLADSDVSAISRWHLRHKSVRSARQVQERLVAGDPVVWRVLAQPAPCRPDLRAPWRPEGSDRHLRARDMAGREAWLGLRRSVAGRGPADRQADHRHSQAWLHGQAGSSQVDRLATRSNSSAGPRHAPGSPAIQWPNSSGLS